MRIEDGAELCSLKAFGDTNAEGGAVSNPEAGEPRAKMEEETVKPVKKEKMLEDIRMAETTATAKCISLATLSSV